MLLAFLLQAAAAPTQAVPSGPGQPPATMVVEPAGMAVAAWDADGDGRTTRVEMIAGVRLSFAALPGAPGSSGIGYIAFADWAERWLGDRNALPSPFEVDANGDDRITGAELEAAFGRVFDRLDKDKDGAVSRKETLTIRASTGGGYGPGGAGGRGRRR